MKESSYIESVNAEEILQKVIESRTPVLMSHMSRGKWHITKVNLTDITPGRLRLEITYHPKRHPINIQIDQPVGLSFKFGRSKYMTEAPVAGFEPAINRGQGGTIVLQMPNHIDVMSRRHYFRVDAPESLAVKVLFWHRGYYDTNITQVPIEDYWQGRLVDISAGGIQIEVSKQQIPHFKKGQLIGAQFTALPYKRPIMFEARIRRITETSDGEHFCLAAQIVGLDATVDGRSTLKRLCGIVEQYHQMNQSVPEAQLIQS